MAIDDSPHSDILVEKLPRFGAAAAESFDHAVFDVLEERGQVGVWTWDFRTEEVIWSAGLHSLFGIVQGRVKPSYEMFNRLVHPDDRAQQLQRAAAMRDGIALDFDFRIIRPNGTIRWLATKTETLTDRDGRPLRVIGIVFDITARKRVEGALGTAEDRLRTLARVSDSILFTARADGAAEIIADPSGGEIGASLASWLELVAEPDRDDAAAAWEASRARGVPFELRCRPAAVLDATGTVELRFAPVIGDEGRVREWIGMIGLPSTQGALGELEISSIVGAQLRAARGMLNWSVRELSEASGVTVATIRRLEEREEASPDAKCALICGCLQEAGARFVRLPSGEIAVARA